MSNKVIIKNLSKVSLLGLKPGKTLEIECNKDGIPCGSDEKSKFWRKRFYENGGALKYIKKENKIIEKENKKSKSVDKQSKSIDKKSKNIDINGGHNG